jgi:CheY-like chemotaxis protein
MRGRDVGSVKRILIVEDEGNVLFILCRAIERMVDGHEVDVASDGQQALEKLQARHYDLVLTDLRLPGLDGVQLTNAIRQHDADTVVLWMTAYGCHRVRDEMQELTVHRCLDKPVKIGELRQIIQEALDSAGTVDVDQRIEERV